MGKKERKAAPAPAGEPMASEGVELPERWSVQRKTELVLRLVRGESLDAVSRENQVPAHELGEGRLGLGGGVLAYKCHVIVRHLSFHGRRTSMPDKLSFREDGNRFQVTGGKPVRRLFREGLGL